MPTGLLLPYSILKNDNWELGKPNLLWNCKMLIDPVGFRRNKTNLHYVFQVKSFGGLGKNDNSELGIFTSEHHPICDSKIPSYHFGHRTKTITWNSEFT